MLGRHSRRLTGRRRTAGANRALGLVLAFVAGAINAGGYFGVRQYTSHMTGLVSSAADELVLGSLPVVLSVLGAVLSFISGSACTALLVNFARRRRLHSLFAMPLLLEAGLLVAFGVLGGTLVEIRGLFVSAAIMLLCFMMGLQNALVTKISNAEIRTTHVTGVVTDLGIELGRFAYWNRNAARPPVTGDADRLLLLVSLLVLFFCGGVVGAFGFRAFGFAFTMPLALVLLSLASRPAVDDLRGAWRRRARAR